MSERDELVARLREGTFGTDITKTDAFLNAITAKAAAQIERDGREIERLTAENQRLREVLTWYGEQARLARLIHSEGDAGRHALAADGGSRARAALRSTEASHDD